MGAITPFGTSVDQFWTGVIEGRSAIRPITAFDVTQFDVTIGGEVCGFEATDALDRKTAKRMDRFAQLAVVAMGEAIADARLDCASMPSDRISVVIGSGIGGLSELEQQYRRLIEKGPSKVSAFTIPKLMVNAAAGNVSIAFGASGSSIAISSACASATNAMGQALQYVRDGSADVVLTGGSEAACTPLALSAFAAMKALSKRNDEPERASRPFDKDRDGFVLSEGAGALIFEELEHAKRRGAAIRAEVIGFGSSSDAMHIAQPSETGAGAAEAMRLSLADAAVDIEDVDYINAHATGTPLGDVAETRAIKTVFGDHASKLVVSSTKGSVGHTLGASGGVELIICALAIQHSVIPPTVNLDEPDKECDLDYCPNTPQDRRIRVALSNSFGFGGHNACLLLKRFE